MRGAGRAAADYPRQARGERSDVNLVCAVCGVARGETTCPAPLTCASNRLPPPTLAFRITLRSRGNLELDQHPVVHINEIHRPGPRDLLLFRRLSCYTGRNWIGKPLFLSRSKYYNISVPARCRPDTHLLYSSNSTENSTSTPRGIRSQPSCPPVKADSMIKSEI